MNELMTKLPLKEISQFIDYFKLKVEQNESLYPQWLFNLKRIAIEQFAEIGFPSADDEDWRFTNITPITRINFKFPAPPDQDSLAKIKTDQILFNDLPINRVVFVDGYYVKQLSGLVENLPQVYIGSLSEYIAKNPDALSNVIGRSKYESENAFSALNTALFVDGAFIQIPAGVELRFPVHIVHISSGFENNSISHPKNIILAGRQSALTMIETYVSNSAVVSFTNPFTKFVIDSGAYLEHIRCQVENLNSFNIGTTYARVAGDAKFYSHSVAIGGKIARHNIRAELGGNGIEAILTGLYIAQDNQLVDHHLVVEHIAPHCTSYEYFNGILDDRAKGVFHGRIYVHPEAMKTDAKQTNRNLLLSEEAVINSKPQLEIYADDVKCTHGATVGRLDESALFYLRSRGISFDQARQMLIQAFASEIIERIQYTVAREELDKLVGQWLERRLRSPDQQVPELKP